MLRRARLYTKGDCIFITPVSYELEIGYIPDTFYIENSYLEFPNLGVLGSLKVGQYQPPMGLVTYGSSRDMIFMEPASPLQALAPWRQCRMAGWPPRPQRSDDLGFWFVH